jgi:hypothetical protein
MVVFPLSGSLGNRAGGAAFIEMPDLSVTPDPSGPTDPFNPQSIPGNTLPSGGDGYGASADWSSYQNLGSLGVTYDWPIHRWLPVRPQLVSKDGTHYAYTEFGQANKIHIVDVATASDRVLYAEGRFVATAYDAEGITLVHVGPVINQPVSQPEPDGVWMLNPLSGNIRQVTTDAKYWGDVSSGYAWRRDGDRLLRLSLRTGSIETWGQWPGLEIRVIGFDNEGNPVVDTRHPNLGDQPQINEWVAAAKNQPTKVLEVYNSPQLTEHGTEGFGIPTALGDEHGVWLDVTWGLYQYSNGAIQKRSPLTGQLAGSCR